MAATTALSANLEDHPSYEALAALIEGSADDIAREIVESHATVCRTCAAELADLRAFTQPAQRSRGPLWLALAAAAGVAAVLLFPGRRADPVSPPPLPRAQNTIAPPAGARYARAEWQAAVDEALRTGRVAIPADLHSLTMRDVFRGTTPGSGTATFSPAATVVFETRPQFVWTGVPADGYEVRVYQEYREVARSELQRGTTWLCSRQLERGKTYRWQIVARRHGQRLIFPSPPTPPAVFRVLGASEYEELSAAEQQHPADDLLLGVLYARAGVLDRARDHLARYASQVKTPIAEKLLHEIHP